MLDSEEFLRKVHNQEAAKIDYRFYFVKIFIAKRSINKIRKQNIGLDKICTMYIIKKDKYIKEF